MIPFYVFAKQFGWPPSVVRRESHLQMRALLAIDEAANEVAERRRRQQDLLDQMRAG